MIIRLEVQRDDGTKVGGAIPNIDDRPAFKAALARLTADVEETIFREDQ